MASTAFSLEAPMKTLYEEGFLDLDDPKVGELVLEVEQRGFPYVSDFLLRIRSGGLGRCTG
ncbi:hypothetical protein BS50DRAFT_580453 [Corynespora cassiicola Philippines]|uniref:Uncharacterized protein n=1 Tax=Corynespora cassiicola Philippines TaxID=1448308 RepID=A0A2T2N189_CORCC|nr:hypothetical protein BS50DRAFT_580453 [Corynespora cassiicola Philippines]